MRILCTHPARLTIRLQHDVREELRLASHQQGSAAAGFGLERSASRDALCRMRERARVPVVQQLLFLELQLLF